MERVTSLEPFPQAEKEAKNYNFIVVLTVVLKTKITTIANSDMLNKFMVLFGNLKHTTDIHVLGKVPTFP
jgi:hypothetical protein